MEVSRRLAAIFAADVAGYSRLMAASEEGTLRVLKESRSTMDGSIAAHHGRIVGTAGDSVLAEFPSPVDAVSCAVEIQRALAQCNAGLPERQRMEFRIGINLGDVLVDGAQIYGDGVNVAARLEGMAEAGGILISGSVFDQIGNKLPFLITYEGRHRVKNIPGRIRMYSVGLTEAAGPVQRLRQRLLQPAVAAAVGFVITASLVAAGVLLWPTTESERERAVRLSKGAEGEKVRTIRDCREECPELVVVPAGSFTMGAAEGEENRHASEGPAHGVVIAKPFAIGRYEVTFAQWDACLADGGCRSRPNDRGWGRGNRPVIYVSWKDTVEYVDWLSRRTGKHYRLPSEAEWEYAARAGTRTPYWWGETVGEDLANCLDCGASAVDRTTPVGSHLPNPFGLYDVHGNVWEWVRDCWAESYAGAPTDGSAMVLPDCNMHVVRGGAWGLSRNELRVTRRIGDRADLRSGRRGFRVVRDLP